MGLEGHCFANGLREHRVHLEHEPRAGVHEVGIHLDMVVLDGPVGEVVRGDLDVHRQLRHLLRRSVLGRVVRARAAELQLVVADIEGPAQSVVCSGLDAFEHIAIAAVSSHQALREQVLALRERSRQWSRPRRTNTEEQQLLDVGVLAAEVPQRGLVQGGVEGEDHLQLVLGRESIQQKPDEQ